VEVAGLETADAQEVHRELSELRSRLSVYRGQLLELLPGGDGRLPGPAATAREDVVLADGRPAAHRAAHPRRGVTAGAAATTRRQHLKRGLLLYGPPGTGKTHTTRYVVQHLDGSTVFLLSGRSLHLIGMVTSLARELQPAVVVLEDVDLVAEDRGYGDGASPVLFELLDAMDGAAADADLLFLLTTNRADLLEPALAARPGRVDVAVEIGLPDADSRRRLFEVYSRGVPLAAQPADLEAVVERTEGRDRVGSSRSSSAARPRGASPERPGRARAGHGEHLPRALDDLLDCTQTVTPPARRPGRPVRPPVSAPMDRGYGGTAARRWMDAGPDLSGRAGPEAPPRGVRTARRAGPPPTPHPERRLTWTC
jgi:hypothetical protein